MPALPYYLVDVFTNQKFGGNQLAVLPKPGDLSAEQMQQIAKEFNLSETTFVFPTDSEADFHVRIFTPANELPMAGHPTVGTAFVLAKQGIISLQGPETLVRFLEGVGVIDVRILTNAAGDMDMITMQQPLPQFGEMLEDKEQIAAMLSINTQDIATRSPIQVVSTGVPFLFIPIQSLDAMGRLRLRSDVWNILYEETGIKSLFMFTLETQYPDSDVHSRMFAPAMGIPEDPATGSASGPLGAYLRKYNLIDKQHIISEQGIEMGRPSFIHIDIDYANGEFNHVIIGGQTVSMGHGFIEL